MPRRGRRIAGHISPDASSIVVVPVGSWEQHGPHLPFDTDSVIAESLVDAAVERAGSPRFFVAPTVAYSASDEHAGFPGLLSVGTQATVEVLVSLARSAAAWSRGTVFVNGHGGNADALVEVKIRLDAEQITHQMWWPHPVAGRESDLHAGWTETSVMLHLAPDVVAASELPTGATGDAAELVAHMRAGGVAAVSDNGVVGDARGATAVDGKGIFETWVDSLARCLADADTTWPHPGR